MPRYTSKKYTAKVPDSNGYINYSDDEHQIWHDLFKEQKDKVNKYMSNIYTQGLDIINNKFILIHRK